MMADPVVVEIDMHGVEAKSSGNDVFSAAVKAADEAAKGRGVRLQRDARARPVNWTAELHRGAGVYRVTFPVE